MNDTHPDIHRKHVELLRQAGPERRLQLAIDLTRNTISRAWAGLCQARHEMSDRERELLWVRVNYGRALEERLRRFLAQRDAPHESV